MAQFTQVKTKAGVFIGCRSGF